MFRSRFPLVAMCGVVLVIAAADVARGRQPPVFSGPQVGERLTAVRVVGVYGESEGKEIDLVREAGERTTLLIFVNGANRPAARLTRTLIHYAEMRADDGLYAAMVYLADDRTEATAGLNRGISWYGFNAPVGISLDGAEGPGAYGLNRNVNLTILVAQHRRVKANFALVQPSVTDAPRVLGEVIKLIDGEVPSQEVLTFLAMPTRSAGAVPWRKAPSDVELRRLVCRMIAVRQDPALASPAAKAIEAYVGDDRARQLQLGEAALILGAQLDPSPIRPHLRKWATLFDTAASQTGRQMRATSPPAAKRNRSDRVEVIRDRWGTAHVYADDETALFYGAGYATAEDRLFQMMLFRRVVEGRLAEVLGPGPDDRWIDSDRKFRILGLARHAQAMVPHLADDTRRNLKAYAAGVNAYIQGRNGRLPPLFDRYGGRPRPWRATDCLAVWQRVAERFSGGWEAEVAALRSRQQAGRDSETLAVVPGGHVIDDSAAVVTEEEFRRSDPDVYDRLKRMSAAIRRETTSARRKTTATPSEPHATKASHNWVVSGAKSTTGKPILESDPHVSVTAPPLWYEIHLIGGRYNVRGVGVAGSPCLLVGWNERCAWGVTALGGDTADLFREQTHPDDPARYRWRNSWQSFETRRETIHIKGRPPLHLRVRSTRHGPVINQLVDDTRPDETFALGYAPLRTTQSSVEALLTMMRATDWQSFRAGMRDYAAPPAHVIYADVAGNIGYQAMVLAPADYAPRAVPRNGASGEDEWKMVPFDELPHMLNPRAGFISTANNLAVGSWYPYVIGAGVGDGPRSWRLRELLSADRKFAPEDFLRIIHQDSTNPALRDFVSLAVAVLKVDPVADAKLASAVAALKEWDGRLLTDRSAYLIAHHVHEELLNKKLSGTPMQVRYGTRWAGVTALLKKLTKTYRATGKGPRDVAIRDWLRRILLAGIAAAETAADDSATFVHLMPYQHNLDGFGSLDPRHDLRSPPMSVPITQTIWSQPSNSYTMIVDLADVDRSMSMLPPGISEDPGSPHFRDQIELWMSGSAHPAPLSRKGVESVRISTTWFDIAPAKGDAL